MTTGRANGGLARAANLDAAEKSAIGQAGAEARWRPRIPEGVVIARAQLANDLILGPVTIPCAVLEDGSRVLSERGIARALGRTRSGSHWQKKREQGGETSPLYLTAENLKPFIAPDLQRALSEPRWYSSPKGGRPVPGIPATVLPDICDVWIQADEANALRKPQKRIAAAARGLQRAFAKTGIVALVDEATGYQEFRSKTELQAILAAYLSEELLPWSQRFPRPYYEEMFRLWNWAWPPRQGIKGPRYAGKLTRLVVYDQLPPGIVAELERINPPDDNWRRKDKNNQWLSGDIGQPHLERQVAVVTNLMKVCDTKEEFLEKFEKAFPGTFNRSRQLSLIPKMVGGDHPRR